MENKEIYITDRIFILNNQLFYETDNRKIKFNKNNWHKYIVDYGFEKLEMGWRKRLKSENSKNSLWGVLDCGGDGDCLFLCLEEAFKNFYSPENEDFSAENIRNYAANQINKNNFDLILTTYRLEEETGEFLGEWEPSKIKNIEELQNEIRKPGNSFWGDHTIIQLLEQALNINIILLNSENEFFENLKYKIQSRGNKFYSDRRTIILYYYLNCHFQLIGYFNGNKMQTIFTFEQIPKEFKKICKEDLNLTNFI